MTTPHAPTDGHHRFAAGQLVRFRWSNPFSNAAHGDYTIVGLLPERDGELQYSIKSDREPYQRIVKEGDVEIA
jgi:hypothetical protein